MISPHAPKIKDSTSQFTEEEDAAITTVANAQIHVECAIGGIKDFQLMQGPIHVTMVYLIEAALIVCDAATTPCAAQTKIR